MLRFTSLRGRRAWIWPAGRPGLSAGDRASRAPLRTARASWRVPHAHADHSCGGARTTRKCPEPGKFADMPRPSGRTRRTAALYLASLPLPVRRPVVQGTRTLDQRRTARNRISCVVAGHTVAHLRVRYLSNGPGRLRVDTFVDREAMSRILLRSAPAARCPRTPKPARQNPHGGRMTGPPCGRKGSGRKGSGRKG